MGSDSPKPDAGADTFQPVHRTGYGSAENRTEWLIGYLTRNPNATLASGEGKMLLDRIRLVEAMLKQRSDNVAP